MPEVEVRAAAHVLFDSEIDADFGGLAPPVVP
jgi:hypothetical protein